MTKLQELATAIRSSNAGASLRTFDIMFDNLEVFQRVRASETITPDVIAPLFKISAHLVRIYWYDPASTIKITIPRSVMAGNPEDTDIDGKQQHAPLLDIEIP